MMYGDYDVCSDQVDKYEDGGDNNDDDNSSWYTNLYSNLRKSS